MAKKTVKDEVYKFVDEKNVRFENPENYLSSGLPGTRFEAVPYPVRSLKPVVDGEGLKVGVDRGFEPRNLTRRAFSGLCRTLEIPEFYALKITPELLLENMNKRKEAVDKVAMFYLGRDGGSLHNVSLRVRPVVDLQEATKNLFGSTKEWDHMDMWLNDRGIHILAVSKLMNKEVAKGDGLRMGLQYHLSDSGESTLASGMTLRTLCTNSAIHGTSVCLKYRAVPYELPTFDTFIKEGQELLNRKSDGLFDAIRKTSEVYLTDLEVLKIYGKIFYAVGGEEQLACSVLGVSLEEIATYRAQVDLRRAKVIEKNVYDQEQPTGHTAYAMFNAITQYARDLTLKEPEDVEYLRRYAGRFSWQVARKAA